MKAIKFKLLFLMAIMAITTVGCSTEDESANTAQIDRLVANILIPNNTFYTINISEITIQGRGFEKNDTFTLQNETTNKHYLLEMVTIDNLYITFKVPADIPTNEYELVVTRAEKSQRLGILKFRQSIDLNIPDKSGATIKGAVFCGTEPVVGVSVSDGVTVTQTDDNGYYWLNSNKHHGYVFISLPGGYEPMVENSIARIWEKVSKSTKECEQCNFELTKVDNSNHIMLMFADPHLANRTNDLKQYKSSFIPDVKQFIADNPTKKVYALSLGDMTFDEFWYTNKYGFPEYVNTLKESQLPMTIFNLPGNHDNDEYSTTDFDAEQPFKDHIGPTYYSFNIGKTHYIMLDNVVYINKGATGTSKGDHSYSATITDMQMSWLRADLATITDKSTPIMVGMHCQAHYFNSLLELTYTMDNSSTQVLDNALKGFENVHMFSGHTHNNANMVVGENIMEHNTAAVCATWWWTGYYNNPHICKDGSPGGYGVYEFNDGNLSWYYKGIGLSRNVQMRSYDMNEVKTFFANNAGAKQLIASYPERNDYKNVSENEVYINVWNWDPKWTIRVTESGQELAVERVYQRDPLHTICYDIPRVLATSSHTLTTSFQSSNNSHMFRVTASKANSSLNIEVTDRFNKSYNEVMKRPKAYTVTMQ